MKDSLIMEWLYSVDVPLLVYNIYKYASSEELVGIVFDKTDQSISYLASLRYRLRRLISKLDFQFLLQ